MSDFANDPNTVKIGNIAYTKQISCNDIELIKRLKEEKRINPEIENKNYVIDCTNKNIYIVDPKPIGSGTYNNVYSLLGEHDDKIIRVTEVITTNKYHHTLQDEIAGLFLQYYISNNCRYICKVYEFGYLISDGVIRVYAILEKLTEPDIFGINFERKIPKHNYNYKLIMHQVLEGLKCMNKNNFVHLDIKLENIGIDKDKNAKIFDFGFARYINTNPMTTNDKIFGTGLYVDPEIVYFNKIYLNSDIYSVGNMLNYLYINSEYHGFDKNFNITLLPKENSLPQKYIDLLNNIIKSEDIGKKVELKNKNQLVFKIPIELIDDKYYKRYRFDNYENVISKYKHDKKIINEHVKEDTKNLIKLIKNMMKYDANIRYDAEKSLNDEWFKNIGENSHTELITRKRSNSLSRKRSKTLSSKKTKIEENSNNESITRKKSKSQSRKLPPLIIPGGRSLSTRKASNSYK